MTWVYILKLFRVLNTTRVFTRQTSRGRSKSLQCCHLVGKSFPFRHSNLWFWHVLLLIHEICLTFSFPVNVPTLGSDPDVPWAFCFKIASFNICFALQANVPKWLHNPGNALVIKVSNERRWPDTQTDIRCVDNSSFAHLKMLFFWRIKSPGRVSQFQLWFPGIQAFQHYCN